MNEKSPILQFLDRIRVRCLEMLVLLLPGLNERKFNFYLKKLVLIVGALVHFNLLSLGTYLFTFMT